MEVSGVAVRQIAHMCGRSSKRSLTVGAAARSPSELRVTGFPSSRALVSGRSYRIMHSGFSHNAQLQFYHHMGSRSREKNVEDKDMAKKKLKVLKGFSNFSRTGLRLDPDDQIQGKLISEKAEVLLKQLQQLRSEEKKLKTKRKQETAKRKKSGRMQTILDYESSSSSSSSSESSDSECENVIDMSCLRSEARWKSILDELQKLTDQAAVLTSSILETEQPKIAKEHGNLVDSIHNEEGCCTRTSISCSSSGSNIVYTNDSSSPSATRAPENRIEVCMGNKCKKSGGAALLKEFQQVLGVEGVAFGCKCMGKCRDGPNVRICNSVDPVAYVGPDDPIWKPLNHLLVGVCVEDVGVIVSNLLGEGQVDSGLAASA